MLNVSYTWKYIIQPVIPILNENFWLNDSKHGIIFLCSSQIIIKPVKSACKYMYIN